MRGIGVTAALAGALPPELVPLVLLVTQLGSPWFVLAAPTLAYWAGASRAFATSRDGVRLVAVAITVLAVVVALKTAFALPRPPTSIANVPADGYGFPSGHAMGSAALYGAAAALLTWRTRRVRALLAAGVIAVVCLSRLLLGVHYLVDVAVGVPVGLAVAWTVLAATRRRLAAGFWLATLAGAAALVATHDAANGAAVFGLAVGATVAWTLVERADATLSHPPLPILVGGGVVAGVCAAVGFLLDVPAPLAFVATAIAGGVIVALPAIKEGW